MWLYKPFDSSDISPIDIYSGGILQEDMTERYTVRKINAGNGTITSLFIELADPSYSGSYICRERDGLGPGSKTAELIVISKLMDSVTKYVKL